MLGDLLCSIYQPTQPCRTTTILHFVFLRLRDTQAQYRAYTSTGKALTPLPTARTTFTGKPAIFDFFFHS